jgi:hypothetical protein
MTPTRRHVHALLFRRCCDALWLLFAGCFTLLAASTSVAVSVAIVPRMRFIVFLLLYNDGSLYRWL